MAKTSKAVAASASTLLMVLFAAFGMGDMPAEAQIADALMEVGKAVGAAVASWIVVYFAPANSSGGATPPKED